MISLTVNGETHELDLDPEMPLLWALRDHLGLTGAKYSCGIAQCGACLVLVNDMAMPACVVPLGDIDGAAITTIEGANGRVADAVIGGLDCPVMSRNAVIASPARSSAPLIFLSHNADPSDDEIAQAMDANLCRCGAYQRIRDAVRDARHRLGLREIVMLFRPIMDPSYPSRRTLLKGSAALTGALVIGGRHRAGNAPCSRRLRMSRNSTRRRVPTPSSAFDADDTGDGADQASRYGAGHRHGPDHDCRRRARRRLGADAL